MGHKFRSVNRSDITLRNVYEIRYDIIRHTRYEISFTIEPPCTTAEVELELECWALKTREKDLRLGSDHTTRLYFFQMSGFFPRDVLKLEREF